MNEIHKQEIPTLETKRPFKFKSRIESYKLKNSVYHINKFLTNTHLHVPGKINFHELLSLPLEKQIQKENSLKENQTFCLKFQPDAPIKESIKHHSKERLDKTKNEITKKNSRFLNRKNYTAQKRMRTKSRNQNQQIEEIKQAAKTMYFRPIGKITRNYELQNNERKSFQFTCNIKSKQNQRLEMGTNAYKDKLLMLLQIRKQSRNERKSESSLGNGFNSYRQIKKFSITQNLKEKFDHSKSFKSYRKHSNQQSGTLVKFKRGNKKDQDREDNFNPNQLSPWYLMENTEDF